MTTVWVLLRDTTNEHGDFCNTRVHGVFATRESLDAKIVAIEKANSQYPFRTHSDNLWSVGPDEDEGFFGNTKQWLRAVEKELR